MKRFLLFALCAIAITGCKKETETKTTEENVTTVKTDHDTDQPISISDGKYSDVIKKMLQGMQSGDIDAWMENYADNAHYYWNNGDSLVGKPAIDKFWRERRMNVIESIEFSHEVYLPVRVNKPQSNEMTGDWVLLWYKTNAKYKGGGTMTQFMHSDFHFNADGKIDEVDQYVDRAPIMAAMPKK